MAAACAACSWRDRGFPRILGAAILWAARTKALGPARFFFFSNFDTKIMVAVNFVIENN